MYGEELIVWSPESHDELYCVSDDISSYYLEHPLDKGESWIEVDKGSDLNYTQLL
jgi:hypothetical protein